MGMQKLISLCFIQCYTEIKMTVDTQEVSACYNEQMAAQ